MIGSNGWTPDTGGTSAADEAVRSMAGWNFINKETKNGTKKHGKRYDPKTMICDFCDKVCQRDKMVYIPRRNKFACPDCNSNVRNETFERSEK